MNRSLPCWFFFLGLGVLALLSRRGGWPFLLGKVLAIFGAGVGPPFSSLWLALPVRLALPSLDGGRPSVSGEGWPFGSGWPSLPWIGVGLLSRVKVGPSFSGGPILKGRARPDPRAKEA